MKNCVGENTVILSVMNGISSEKIIGERYGHGRLIDTVAQGMDAMKFGSKLTYTKMGELRIGAEDASQKENLEQVAAYFDEIKMPYTVEEDILRRLWGKFMLNVGVNQTCMAFETNYGGALEEGSRAHETMLAAMREVIALAGAEGIRLTEEDLEEYPQLKMAQSEDDTGVIVSFNSEAEDVTDSLMIPEGTKSLAINPLNWKTDGTAADKSLNKGACFTDYSGAITEEIPQLTGAYIDEARGSLKVPDVSPEDYPAGLSIFTDGIYHLYDYQFFYRNLQENVQTRIQAYGAGR